MTQQTQCCCFVSFTDYTYKFRKKVRVYLFIIAKDMYVYMYLRSGDVLRVIHFSLQYSTLLFEKGDSYLCEKWKTLNFLIKCPLLMEILIIYVSVYDLLCDFLQ